MSAALDLELNEYCRRVSLQAKEASRQLATLSTATKNAWLGACAKILVDSEETILAANAKDVDAGPSYGLSDSQVDRLVLNRERIMGISEALREIAALPDPIGETISGGRRPNGLDIQKVRVPLGTVFFIYESRPNVTADASAICVKSGNAVILRGGKEAKHSSEVIVQLLQQAASEIGLPNHAIQYVETTDREAVGHFLRQADCIDVAIPRGGKGLIERVASEATMPVIKHYDGNCHVYVDEFADQTMAIDIAVNSKCQRMGVCNACESLVIHRAVVDSILPAVAAALLDRNIEIRGDQDVCKRISKAVAASEADWGEEYLGPTISIRVVDSIQAAVDHINRYGSGHTDAIVTESIRAADTFTGQVDSAAVLVNASTRFNDGGEFGLGAEIGISTDKFHARGPCGLQELTTYKYVVRGTGQVR
ncbi:MAG: glutamate-5-semialdehyde dehydrogenase [Aureliella sp.]